MAEMEMVICKSCGYIMKKAKMGDKCPACGVSSKMFLPHDERISARRKLLLSLDIHPVLVHFPQAFTATILLLALAGMALRAPCGSLISATLRLLGLLLPITVAGAFAAGLFDGKIRFKRVKTPLLIRKMFFGALFFILACAIAAMVLAMPQASQISYLLIAVTAAASLGCATVLGLMGTSLLNARFPG